MSVRGALGTMPAEDVLEWVGRRRLSTPITFEHRDTQRSLVVESGAIVWASSNRRDEQLGAILVRSGIVAERALAEALEARAATGVNAQLPIEVCLTVARRRAARMTAIMDVLGSDDATFDVPPTALPPGREDDQVMDLPRIWGMAGDRRTAADIAAVFSGERYETYDALARLVESGRLTVDRRHRERTNSAVELAAGARVRLRQGDRAGALAMATQALHQDPSDAEVRKTFTQIERARVAEVAKQLLSRHRVPKRLRAPAPEHGLNATELELANRVDGRWDLLSLVKSAGVREAEALLAFAHLAEVGVVELG